MFPRFLLVTAIFISVFTGCKKAEDKTGALQITLSYKVDNRVLQLDTMAYTCEAGYAYEITKLNYYLSGFAFTKDDGSLYQSDKVFYMDAALNTTNVLTFENFPPGNYTKVSFSLGLDPMNNMTGMLPASIENINMMWPDAMGGGYHFMKLEGHYRDTTGTFGYAMHLGKNENLVHVQLNRLFSITGMQTTGVNFKMNMNEWFRNPMVYDFNTDGNYSMSSDSAMHKLSANGIDIFD